jgi:hypothetical protein
VICPSAKLSYYGSSASLSSDVYAVNYSRNYQRHTQMKCQSAYPLSSLLYALYNAWKSDNLGWVGGVVSDGVVKLQMAFGERGLDIFPEISVAVCVTMHRTLMARVYVQ